MAGHPYIPSNIERILAPKKVVKRPPGDWKRKTETEISDIKRRLKRSSFDLTMPIGLALCVTSPLIVIGIFNYFDLEIIKASFKIFLPISVITLLCQIISGRSFVKRPKIKICNNCHRETELNLKKCHCGGLYEPPEFYVYVGRELNQDN
jgi:hypothetical protein